MWVTGTGTPMWPDSGDNDDTTANRRTKSFCARSNRVTLWKLTTNLHLSSVRVRISTSPQSTYSVCGCVFFIECATRLWQRVGNSVCSDAAAKWDSDIPMFGTKLNAVHAVGGRCSMEIEMQAQFIHIAHQSQPNNARYVCAVVHSILQKQIKYSVRGASCRCSNLAYSEDASHAPRAHRKHFSIDLVRRCVKCHWQSIVAVPVSLCDESNWLQFDSHSILFASCRECAKTARCTPHTHTLQCEIEIQRRRTHWTSH